MERTKHSSRLEQEKDRLAAERFFAEQGGSQA
jgi:hypothetical protein